MEIDYLAESSKINLSLANKIVEKWSTKEVKEKGDQNTYHYHRVSLVAVCCLNVVQEQCHIPFFF